MRQVSERHSFVPYPENLSRIILTLTCSPIWNQRLRIKFSSIQGSSSPILFAFVNHYLFLHRMNMLKGQPQSRNRGDACLPECRLRLRAWSATRGRHVARRGSLVLLLRLIRWLSGHLIFLGWSSAWRRITVRRSGLGILIVIWVRHFEAWWAVGRWLIELYRKKNRGQEANDR